MARMLDVLEVFLNLHAYAYMRLDGSTKPEQRQLLMQRFNTDPKYFCFILSTRSGGVGINLTGADTVVFYDRCAIIERIVVMCRYCPCARCTSAARQTSFTATTSMPISFHRPAATGTGRWTLRRRTAAARIAPYANKTHSVGTSNGF